MDVRALVRNAQCMSLDEGQDEHSSTQLCDLPDEILWHVLSFLQLKDVVRMSTLSKMWEYLSKNNPRVNVREINFPGQTQFVNFVDRALLLHDFPLKELSICYRTDFDKSKIDAWITAAVRRGVEELNVRKHGRFLEYALPSCVFNCEILIKLQLYMLHLLWLPDEVCLKNLRVLHLSNINFRHESAVEKLLSCPSLEDLSLEFCQWRRLEVVHIFAPKLLRLNIFEDGFYNNLKSTFYLVVHGARIKSFTYSGKLIDRYTISKSSSVATACIDVNFFGWPPHHHAYDHWYMLLKDLSCVQRLAIENVDEFIHKRPDLHESLPLFCNLTELDLSFYCSLFLESRFLVVMLSKCPRLSCLKFTWLLNAESEADDAIFDPAPPCFKSSLKVIKIRLHEMEDKALLAIGNLLRTARVLEKLIIHPPRGSQLSERLLSLLNELPKASDQCEYFLDGVMFFPLPPSADAEQLGNAFLDQWNKQKSQRKEKW